MTTPAGRAVTRRHEGKVVMIVGGARGIGRSAAVQFASEGADVVVCDVGTPVSGAQTRTASTEDLSLTRDLVVEQGARCLTRIADVRDQSTLDDAVAAALNEFGTIDVAIANAGIMQSTPFWEIDERTWSTVLDVNVGGVWRTAKAVAPHMMTKLSGVILATASVQAHVARRGLAAYTASKHAVAGLMKNIALELGEFNVRVNSILPGAIETPLIDNEEAGRLRDANSEEESRRLYFFRRMSVLRGRAALPPSAVAQAMSWLASDEAAHVTGVELPVDSGALILPGYNSSPIVD